MQLTRLIYTSTHDEMTFEAIDHILQRSRVNNERDGITGALVVSEENFMQLLEGDRTAVAKCFMRIIQDGRHSDIQIICAGDAKDHFFHEWSMHLFKASRIKKDILSRYLIDDAFAPAKMSEFAIRDLCRALSAGGWDKPVA